MPSTYPYPPVDVVAITLQGQTYLFGVRNQTLYKINITDKNNITFETDTVTGLPT